MNLIHNQTSAIGYCTNNLNLFFISVILSYVWYHGFRSANSHAKLSLMQINILALDNKFWLWIACKMGDLQSHNWLWREIPKFEPCKHIREFNRRGKNMGPDDKHFRPAQLTLGHTV